MDNLIMQTLNRQLILSSSSPARRALLARLQIPFFSISPDVDERQLQNELVDKMVLRLAESKAMKAAETYPDALIIGSDQVGILDNEILCKPLTHENAVKQLRFMSSKMIRFYTSLCLYDAKTSQSQLCVETYDVYFRELSDEMIEKYLQMEQPFHCAGSFQAEGLGVMLIEKFSGDDYTALIGLPLIQLVKMLEKMQNCQQC
jgi:septum formation protein